MPTTETYFDVETCIVRLRGIPKGKRTREQREQLISNLNQIGRLSHPLVSEAARDKWIASPKPKKQRSYPARGPKPVESRIKVDSQTVWACLASFVLLATNLSGQDSEHSDIAPSTATVIATPLTPQTSTSVDGLLDLSTQTPAVSPVTSIDFSGVGPPTTIEGVPPPPPIPRPSGTDAQSRQLSSPR